MFEAFKTFTNALNASDVGALGRAGLDEAAGWVKRARSALDAYEARLLTAANRAFDGGAAGAELMRTAAGCSQREARRRARRAETLAQMPAVAGALAEGAITAEHADALVKAAEATSTEAVDTDTALLAKAESLPADMAAREVTDWTSRQQSEQDREAKFRRQRALRSHRTWIDADGMFNTRGRFDPVTGACIRSVIDDTANRLYQTDGGRDGGNKIRTWDQRNADALAAALGVIPAPAVTGTGADTGTDADEPSNGQHPEFRNDHRHAAEPVSKEPGFGVDTPGRGVARGQVRRRASGDGAPVTGPAGRNKPQPAGRNKPQPAGRDQQQPAGRGQQHPPTTEPTSQDQRQPPATAPAGRSKPQPASQGRHGPSLRNQILVVAHIDAITGADPDARCEIPGTGPIPRSELERLACEAELFGILFDGHGLPLWHGRRTRTVTPQQWRTLVARDRGCVLCGAAPSYCHAHHIVPWTAPAEGPTDIDNLVLVCNRHHHHIHQHHLTLTRAPDGQWTTADSSHQKPAHSNHNDQRPASRDHTPAARPPTSIRAGP